jgi:hypothetical protein
MSHARLRDKFPLSGVYPPAIIPLLGRGDFGSAPSPGQRVHDHLRRHRRLAFRAVAIQAAVTLVAGATAAACAGSNAGWAAGIGAVSIALATAVQAQLALAGGVQSPGSAFARLLLGTLAKWVVVVAVWWGAIGVVGKAPVWALAGLSAALLVHPLTVLLDTKVKRER